MRLHELTPSPGAKKPRKRVGRGVASGHGATSGRGNKGRKQRSGGTVRPGFEGGQMPIHRRLPKRGFTNIFKKIFAIVNVEDLGAFEGGVVVDEAALRSAGLVKGQVEGVKLLGQGEIAIPLTIQLTAVSKSARAKIEAAGGSVA